MSAVYSCWAFTKDEKEKMKANMKFYEENKDKIKFQRVGRGYAHLKYKLLENPENLSETEVACIMDEGNLCFGYRIENGIYIIHTD